MADDLQELVHRYYLQVYCTFKNLRTYGIVKFDTIESELFLVFVIHFARLKLSGVFVTLSNYTILTEIECGKLPSLRNPCYHCFEIFVSFLIHLCDFELSSSLFATVLRAVL